LEKGEETPETRRHAIESNFDYQKEEKTATTDRGAQKKKKGGKNDGRRQDKGT